MFKFLILTVTVICPCLFSLANGEIEKRQVGVLARTGVLPQGKRGLESLARNGELPGKRTGLSQEDRQRIYRIANWMTEMDATQRLHDALEHEVMKRNMEAMARSGYLVKPATEAPEPRTDLLDSEDFLGKVDAELLANEDGFNVAAHKRGGLASLARHGYVGKREDEDEYDDQEDDDDKRSIGAAKNFLTSKRNIASYKSFLSRYGKRNIGSFRNFNSGKRHVGAARNFAIKREYFDDDDDDDFDLDIMNEKRNIASARRFTGKRNLGAARNFLFNEAKRNLGAARQFFASENKKNLGAAKNFYHGKRNLASFARDGGFSNLRQLRREEDYPWDEDEDFDFDDYHENDKRHLAAFLRNQSGKRYLGSLRAGKRNLAAFKNLGKRDFDAEGQSVDDDDGDILGKELDDASMIEKRETKREGGSRRKRSAEFAFPELGPDVTYFGDYEDEPIANTFDKRFLGSYAATPDVVEIGKRHIGALARLGLLPAFRSTRYSRSGRAINNIIPFREDSPIRACPTAENSAPSWSSASPAATQLALRRSNIMSYAPTPSRTRHPMSYHRNSYV